MWRSALLLSALAGCSLGFTGEGLAVSRSSPDGGGLDDAGTAQGSSLAMVTGAGSGETLLVQFDERG